MKQRQCGNVCIEFASTSLETIVCQYIDFGNNSVAMPAISVAMYIECGTNSEATPV